MRVNIIDGGNTTVQALLYTPTSQNFINYIQANLPSLDNAIKGLNSNFIQTIHNTFINNYSDEALLQGRIYLYNTGQIQYLDYNNLYVPNNYIMQQYIMAQPDLNKLYRKGLVYGYNDTYVDLEVDTYGKDNSAYRRVMDGVLDFVETKDGEFESFVHTYSQDDEDYLGEDISVQDQIKILDTWNNVTLALYDKLDPTDPEYLM